MARPGKPWWWESRGCWAANVNGVRETEKSGVPKSDRLAAEIWYRGITNATVAVPRGSHTVGDLVTEYHAWDLERVRAGERDAAACRSSGTKLKTITITKVKGVAVGTMRANRMDQNVYAQMVRAWADYSDNYRHVLASSIKTVFSWASKTVDGRAPLIPSNPLADARLPKPATPHEKFAERSEAAAWLRFLWRNKGVNRGYVLLQRCLIHTGARPSEWTRATWGEINWSARPVPILTRRRWKNDRKGNQPRRVFIPPRVQRALRRAGEGRDGLIFTTKQGNAWRANYLSLVTQRLRDEAASSGVGITGDGENRLTCYRWRHTAASNLLMAGVDIATTAKLLGTSADQISRTYGHLMPDHLAAAASQLAHRTSRRTRTD